MWRNTLRCWLALGLLSISCVAVQPQVARVPVRIIVTETQEKAEHALGELKAGADFAAVAKAESTDPTAAEGGSLGMVTPDGLRTELRNAMQGLSPGQFSGVVQIPTGYAILKIDKPDDQVAQDTAPAADASPMGSAEKGPIGMDAVSLPLGGQDIVRLPPDTSGLMDVEAAFQTVAKPEGWNSNMASVCRIHDGPLLPILTDTVHKLLASPDAASLSPMEQMQYHYALAVFASYKGDMDQAIAEWQKCYSIDQADVPAGVETMEEVLEAPTFIDRR